MRIERITGLVDETPLLADLQEVHRSYVARCADEITFAAGHYLARAGDPADRFFILLQGSVLLETAAPEHGSVAVETLGRHEIVGWSWLFPPYHWHLDVRALEDVHALAVDGATLRVWMDKDPYFGVALLRRFAGVMLRRLQSARGRIAAG